MSYSDYANSTVSELNYIEVDWNSRRLTDSLIQQTINDKIDNLNIITSCAQGPYPVQYKGMILTHKECATYEDKFNDYVDIAIRDMQMIYAPFPVYAVVILNGDNYIGHIYVWAVDGVAYLGGIRKTPLAEVYGVATYLFEGARRMALELDCSLMVVVKPLMRVWYKLHKLGFKPVTGLFPIGHFMQHEQDYMYCSLCFEIETSKVLMEGIELTYYA